MSIYSRNLEQPYNFKSRSEMRAHIKVVRAWRESTSIYFSLNRYDMNKSYLCMEDYWFWKSLLSTYSYISFFWIQITNSYLRAKIRLGMILIFQKKVLVVSFSLKNLLLPKIYEVRMQS